MQTTKRENYSPAQMKGVPAIKMTSLAYYYQTYSSGPYLLVVSRDVVLVTFCGFPCCCYFCCCLFIVHKTKARVNWEEATSLEKIRLID